jgi:isoaspartyl peptidase/L-asparaginase-like protein (Ntn-hydrolase superfamily)
VDNEIGGACATGLGEAVIKMVGSHLVVELMRQGHSPQQACEAAVNRIVTRQKNYKDLQVGFLALNKAGEAGAYAIQGGFNYALHNGRENVLIDARSFVK